MPAEPSSQLLSRMLKKPTPTKGPMRQPKPLDPSWLRSGFEGGMDLMLGALGIGPDTQMNRVGGLVGMALPLGKKLGRYPEVDIRGQIPSQNKLAMGVNPSSGIYDDVGRYLGPGQKIDPAYEAHVASSRNKFPPAKQVGPSEDAIDRILQKKRKPLKIQSMEESFVERGNK